MGTVDDKAKVALKSMYGETDQLNNLSVV